MTALDFAVYATVQSPLWFVAYWLLMLTPKGVLCAWNHHHQHVATFKFTVLNRLLEQSYALHTGMGTNAWLLHHVLGHHQNFLDQEKDESRWKRRDGTPMGVLEYTFNVALTAYPRAYRVGKRFPAHQRRFVAYTAVTFALVATLVALKPFAGFMLFVLPMICSLLYTAWVTYDHHAGLDSEDPFQASFNNLNPSFNRLTGNLGYHTAHHHRQGVHWSKLPELHARIEHKIPQHLYRKSTYADFLPSGHQAGPAASPEA
ncbi:MAG: fatty acid desaturase [Polyangiales bacterium]